MHLSLKSSLGRQILTGTYVKDNRVLDLTTPFSELTFTLDDRSGEGNDATLYTGRYVSTDGVADKAINADCSAAGSALYYLTAWVRSSTTGTKWAQVSPTSSCYFTVATANVWQQLISTTILSEDVPSDVALGFADSTFPLTYSAANWSDVRLVNATTGATVARWQLNESADGDLNGYPALDSSGNGYHGTHTGCAGGTGEGIDSDVVGAAFAANEDKMFFDGVNDYVQLDSTISLAVGEYVEVVGYWQSGDRIYLSEDIAVAVDFLTITDAGVVAFRVNNIIYTHGTAATGGSINTLRLTRTAAGSYTATINGTSEVFATVPAAINLDQIGATTNASFYFTGLTLSVDYNGTAVWTNTGTSSGTGYTVNGSPVTVGQKRATILQTAGMDWNKYYYPDASWDSSAGAGFSYDASFTENSLNGFVGNTSSNFGLCMLDLDAAVLTGDTVSIVLKVNSFTGATPRIGLDATQAPTAGAIVSNSVDLSVGIQTINLVATGTAKSIRVTQATSPSTIDVEWFMITTSNGGTAMLSPASDATPTNDALGNAIAEPRPTADTWNLFGDGEYGRVADADSLDLTTEASWEIWVNAYGDAPSTSETILSKTSFSDNKRTYDIVRSPLNSNNTVSFAASSNGQPETGFTRSVTVPDQVSQVAFVFDGSGTSLTAYVNGVATAFTDSSGTIPSSIHANDNPLMIGARPTAVTGANFYNRQISRPKIYNVAFTADEVLKNYNAQKGAFGL